MRKLRNTELSLEALAEEYDRIASEEARCWDEIDRNGEVGWADVFERIADQHQHRTGIIEVESGTSHTFIELDRAADKIAWWVHTHVKEDRIGIYHKNSFAYLAAVLGLAKAGKPAVLLLVASKNYGLLVQEL